MKFLRCLICYGEVDIIDSSSLNKKIKCLQCGFSNRSETKTSEPEVLIMRRRPIMEE